MRIKILFSLLLFLPLAGTLTGQSPSYIQKYTPATYKAGPSIYHVIKDQRDILYFATNKGILEYDGSEWKIIEVGNYSDIKFVRQGPDGIIYVGANNDFGYLATDTSSGKLSYYSLVPFLEEPFGDFNEVWQVEFYDGKVYFQSYPAIFEWDGKRVRAIPADEVFIFNIAGNLYASSYLTSEFGIFKDGEIEVISGLGELNDMVYSAFPWNDSTYLLATSDNGLYFFDIHRKKIEAWKCAASSFLHENWFFDGVRIDNDKLALGSWEGGVIIINTKGEILTTLDKESGLLANMVYHIALGSNHDLWLGTTDGIVNINLDSLKIPFQLEEPSDPTTIIREVSVDNQTIYSRPLSIENSRNIDSTLVLKDMPNSIVFRFANPALAGQDVLYSTRLAGYEEWNEWSTDPKKEYTGLNRGYYTFYVKAKHGNGNEISMAGIPFHIDVPWYESPLKFLLVFPIAGLLAYGFIRLRTQRLKSINRHLERTVDHRTKDLIEQQKRLQNINEELIATNNELDSFVYHTSHDLKAPLKSIMGLVSLSKKEAYNNDNHKLYLDMIEKSIHKLEEFIASIIEYSQNSKGVSSDESINFHTLLDEITEELQEFEELPKIDIRRSISIDKEFRSDPKRLKIILNNLITNSVKYHDLSKEDPFIDVNISQNNSSIHIKVTDNGSGIKKEYHPKIFDMFYRASEKSWGSGLGLYIIRETIKKLEGTISMESEYGLWTSFKITLPYSK